MEWMGGGLEKEREKEIVRKGRSNTGGSIPESELGNPRNSSRRGGGGPGGPLQRSGGWVGTNPGSPSGSSGPPPPGAEGQHSPPSPWPAGCVSPNRCPRCTRTHTRETHT